MEQLQTHILISLQTQVCYNQTLKKRLCFFTSSKRSKVAHLLVQDESGNLNSCLLFAALLQTHTEIFGNKCHLSVLQPTVCKICEAQMSSLTER